MTSHFPANHLQYHPCPLPFLPRNTAEELSCPNRLTFRGGGALTGEFLFVWVVALVPKEIARSEQLRDRSATFGQKGCSFVQLFFEQFNEQWEIL